MVKEREEKESQDEGKKICFIIAPIGDEGSEIRKRSDQVLKHIIRHCVESLGYKPLRADQISKPGIITNQVIQLVINSPLVIADMTGHNPNVFYELAIRHAIKKPLIQMIRKGEQIPFDVGGTRTIQYDLTDPDSIETAKQQLIDQIKSTESQDWSDTDNPISVSLDLEILRVSRDPKRRPLTDVLLAISDIRMGKKEDKREIPVKLGELKAGMQNAIVEELISQPVKVREVTTSSGENVSRAVTSLADDTGEVQVVAWRDAVGKISNLRPGSDVRLRWVTIFTNPSNGKAGVVLTSDTEVELQSL